MRVWRGILLVFLLALWLQGCSPRAEVPTVTPAEPSPLRVGVVDLDAVSKAHPRWKDLEAINRQIEALEVRRSSPPPPPPLPELNLDAVLTKESARLQNLLRQEVEARRQQVQRELDDYAKTLRRQQEARLTQRQKELEAEIKQAVEERRNALVEELRTYEQQVMEEYRIPLLNLRLKLQTVRLTSREEGERLIEEIERLQSERDAKIKAKEEEINKSLAEFAKAKEEEANEQLKALQASLNNESQALFSAREKALREQLEGFIKGRQKELNARLQERRRQMEAQAWEQIQARQEQYARMLEAFERQVNAELAARRQEQARLLDSIMAEVKIELATVAQRAGVDVVLTRAYYHTGAIDLTQDLINRLKR